jgi:hypothetical protein
MGEAKSPYESEFKVDGRRISVYVQVKVDSNKVKGEKDAIELKKATVERLKKEIGNTIKNM